MAAAPPPSPAPAPSFEDNLRRLEAIVSRLESPDLTLEESLRLFQEGTTLSRELHRSLADAERTIEVLTGERDGDGRLRTAPIALPAED